MVRFVIYLKDVKCPMELSTYFRINNEESGQFERTLIIAEERSSVNYLEGCTAPQFSSNQLHAAVVELVALKMQRLNIQQYKIGMPAMKMVLVVFIILLLNEAFVLEKIRVFLGRKLKQDQVLLGNIRVVFYLVKILLANSFLSH